MLEWYSDNKLAIFFDTIPQPKERFIVPYMSDEQKESVKEYPYGNLRELAVTIFDLENLQKYEFVIPKGYCSDGASIPGIILKTLIGAKTDNRFLIAAIIHDWMCEHHECVGYNRNLSSRIFKALLLVGGTPPFKAQLMYLAVDLYQRTQGWKKPQEKDDRDVNEVR